MLYLFKQGDEVDLNSLNSLIDSSLLELLWDRRCHIERRLLSHSVNRVLIGLSWVLPPHWLFYRNDLRSGDRRLDALSVRQLSWWSSHIFLHQNAESLLLNWHPLAKELILNLDRRCQVTIHLWLRSLIWTKLDQTGGALWLQVWCQYLERPQPQLLTLTNLFVL